jgi:hypothetical protein
MLSFSAALTYRNYAPDSLTRAYGFANSLVFHIPSATEIHYGNDDTIAFRASSTIFEHSVPKRMT